METEPRLRRSLQIGRLLLALSFLGTMAALIYAIPEHVRDLDWPVHARNHALLSLFWVCGLCLMGLSLVIWPVRRGDYWAWWALMVAGIALYGGYFAAIELTHGGAPGPRDDLVFAALAAAHFLGWWLTAPEHVH